MLAKRFCLPALWPARLPLGLRLGWQPQGCGDGLPSLSVPAPGREGASHPRTAGGPQRAPLGQALVTTPRRELFMNWPLCSERDTALCPGSLSLQVTGQRGGPGPSQDHEEPGLSSELPCSWGRALTDPWGSPLSSWTPGRQCGWTHCPRPGRGGQRQWEGSGDSCLFLSVVPGPLQPPCVAPA